MSMSMSRTRCEWAEGKRDRLMRAGSNYLRVLCTFLWTSAHVGKRPRRSRQCPTRQPDGHKQAGSKGDRLCRR